MTKEEFKTKINTIIQGNSLSVLKTFPDECVDLIITSPPYFAQRDYSTNPQIWGGKEDCQHQWENHTLNLHSGRGDCQKNGLKYSEQEYIPDVIKTNQICSICGAFRGELGVEPSLFLYIDHLFEIFMECKRVLKKTGSMYINIGDTAFGGGRNRGGKWGDMTVKQRSNRGTRYENPALLYQWGKELPKKTLSMIPSRLAIKLIDEGKMLLRSEIIWQKPNQFPSSATDRFTRDFEYLYFFSKCPNYYFEQQFEPIKQSSVERAKGGSSSTQKYVNGAPGQSKQSLGKERLHIKELSEEERQKREKELPTKRNMRSVWSIPTKAFKGSHFATFPCSLIETPIKASCPKSICSKCGLPKIKTLEKINTVQRRWFVNNADGSPYNKQGSMQNVYKETDYTAQCDCGEKFEPGIVLDPFMGSGTTGVVAKQLGRNYIGIELNETYIKMAEKRIRQTVVQDSLGIDEEFENISDKHLIQFYNKQKSFLI